MSSSDGMAFGGTSEQGMPPRAQPVAHHMQGEDGLSTRPMRLKVLYTFDDQNKTNCLARWPDILSIQTIVLDMATTIGVVELQTCIKAVVECSPELIPQMDKDYTVYAYDYSEYDNPLVGQGMLSRALVAASPTPGAPASQSRQLVTGRVCKNILGLFTNGVKETLEVKLRLVPVLKAVQGDYFNAMEKYRDLSKGLSARAELAEWASFLHSNPSGAAQFNKTPQIDCRSMEVVNQLLSPSPVLLQHPAREPMMHLAQNPNLAPREPGNAESSVEAGRSVAPKGKAAKGRQPPIKAATKRPRVKKQLKKPATSGGNTSGYEEGTDADDGTLPRKRAKTMRTDWNSKSTLGSASESLRVAASTAGSLRLFRPIAISGGPISSHQMQEVPRVPTPVPLTSNLGQLQESIGHSNVFRQLSEVSQACTSPKHISPYPPIISPAGSDSQIRPSIETSDPSPERNRSPDDSPRDIRSSPPVMRGSTLMRSTTSCPSSPDLPSMPHTDSGFMSGSIDHLFGEDDEMKRRSDPKSIMLHGVSEPDSCERANKKKIHLTIEEECPGPPEMLPTRMLPKPSKAPNAVSTAPPSRGGSVISDDGQALPPPKKLPGDFKLPSPAPSQIIQHAVDCLPQPCASFQIPIPPANRNSAAANQSSKLPSQEHTKDMTISQPSGANSIMMSSRTTNEAFDGPNLEPRARPLIRTASLGSLSLPTPILSDPVAPPPLLQRSMTYTELAFVTHDSDPAQFAISEPSYSRTAQAKRDANQRRLEVALQNGEMPTFCENCGAIETPTWRKAWAQEIQGPPGYHEYSDEPGKVTMVVIMNRDAAGAPTSHLIIKKFLLPKENSANYKEYYLCNPCGIWMSKYKCHRPEDRWDKPHARPAPPKKRPTQRAAKPRKLRVSDNSHPVSEASYPQSEPNFPQCIDQSLLDMTQIDGGSPVGSGESVAQDGQGPAVRSRHGSERPIKRARPLTSDAASAALKRAIQSSPAARWGSQQSPIDVEESHDLGTTRRLLFPSPKKDGSSKVLGEVTTNLVHIAPNNYSPKDAAADMADKENCPPTMENVADLDLMNLFEEESHGPATPVQKNTPTNPFKTPTRPASNHRPVTRSVTRSNKCETRSSARITPSITPISSARRRSTRSQDQVLESPFTVSLNQLLTDANDLCPSRNGNSLDIDFDNLPDLPAFDQNAQTDLDFRLVYDTEDFFSTDIPMPSSPPRPFRLYEDPLADIDDVNWNDFTAFDMDEEKLDDLPKSRNVQIKQESQDDNNLAGMIEKPEKEGGQAERVQDPVA